MNIKLHTTSGSRDFVPAYICGPVGLVAEHVGARSFAFLIDGTERRIENGAPFSSFGDTNGKPILRRLAPGKHRVEIGAFPMADANGVAMAAYICEFEVVADFVPIPPPVEPPPPVKGSVTVDIDGKEYGPIEFTIPPQA
jgi:hypothetical protein